MSETALPDAWCPHCGRVTPHALAEQTTAHTYHDIPVDITEPVSVCSICTPSRQGFVLERGELRSLGDGLAHDEAD